MAWKRLNGQPIEDIVIEVESILLKAIAEGTELRVCIGADSQVYSTQIEFATAIVFIRKGNGGFMLVNKEHMKTGMGIRERMIAEVSRAVQTAYQLSKLWDNTMLIWRSMQTSIPIQVSKAA